VEWQILESTLRAVGFDDVMMNSAACLLSVTHSLDTPLERDCTISIDETK